MAANSSFPTPAVNEQTPGFPASPTGVVFQDFAGMNTKASRPAIQDSEMSWCSGFMPIGPGNLRTMWGLGPAIYAAPSGLSIQWFGFGNIGSTPFCFTLLSDGSLTAVNTNTGSASVISGAGTVSNPSSIFGFSQWGQLYVLFASAQTNGYWIWDGSTFYAPGSTGPDGKTVATGISGTTIETFSGHVWVGTGNLGNVSAPGTVSDFTGSDGATSFASTDSFLRRSYTAFKQTNGFLYLLADSSINAINNVQTSGTPPDTTFVNNNVDPQVGTPWPATVQLVGRNIILANPNGVYVTYGGASSKVSDALDGIYASAGGFGSFIPSAAVAQLFGIACYTLLLPIIDPYTGQRVNKLLLFDGKKWWASDQDIALTFIAGQEINSTLTAYGTDGASIYPMFAQPSSGFTKVAQSKLYAVPSYLYTKEQRRLYGIVVQNEPGDFNLTVEVESELGATAYAIPATGGPVVTWTNASGATAIWTNSAAAEVSWGGTAISAFGPIAVAAQGALAGLTAVSTSPDMTLVSLTSLIQRFTARA